MGREMKLAYIYLDTGFNRYKWHVNKERSMLYEINLQNNTYEELDKRDLSLWGRFLLKHVTKIIPRNT